MQDARILMAGCGALGQRIGLALAENHHVFGMRRQASRVPLPLTPIQADLLDPASLTERIPEVDAVVVCLTPDQYDEAGPQTPGQPAETGVLHILDGCLFPEPGRMGQ